MHQAKIGSPKGEIAAYDEFVLIIPVIREHARFSFRKKNPEEKEELIEECLANAFRAYTRLIELGKQDMIYPTVLAKFAVKQVISGRRVGGSLNSDDILSRYAQLRRDITIKRLDRYDPEEKIWKEAVVEDTETPIPEQVAFRVDFPAWLQLYQPSKRRVAEALALGYWHAICFIQITVQVVMDARLLHTTTLTKKSFRYPLSAVLLFFH